MNTDFWSDSRRREQQCHEQLYCLTGTTEIVRVIEKMLHYCFLVFPLLLVSFSGSASGNQLGKGQLKSSMRLALLFKEM